MTTQDMYYRIEFTTAGGSGVRTATIRRKTALTEADWLAVAAQVAVDTDANACTVVSAVEVDGPPPGVASRRPGIREIPALAP